MTGAGPKGDGGGQASFQTAGVHQRSITIQRNEVDKDDGCECKSGNRQQYGVLDGGHGGRVLDDGQVSADAGADGLGGVVVDLIARSGIEAVPICHHVREISKAAVETCSYVFICCLAKIRLAWPACLLGKTVVRSRY